MNAYYHKNYARTVKPRYRADYKGELCIVTKDKAQVDIIRKNYKGRCSLSKIDNKTFIITIKEAHNVMEI